MKRFKKFILSMLLNKRERIVIWNALWFSNHTYRRRGDINGAISVSQVMKDVEYILGVTSQRYTKEDVDKIVNKVIENISKELFAKRMLVGLDKGMEEGDKAGFIVIREISPNYQSNKEIDSDSKEETETSTEGKEECKKEEEQSTENK